MGSPCEVLIEAASEKTARAASEAVASEAWRIEDKFSRYLEGSVVHRINTATGKPVAVDDETARLVDFATTLYRLSDGRFDITSGVLREVWLFDGSDRLPEAAAVEAVLQRVGWDRASWVAPELTLPAGMEIDLGGIGKEYAVDRCVEVLRARIDAPGLVNFGGDLAVTGPPRRRPTWRVAVEGPTPDAPDRMLDLRHGGVATIAGAGRYPIQSHPRPGDGLAGKGRPEVGHRGCRYLHPGRYAQYARDAAGQGRRDLPRAAGDSLLVPPRVRKNFKKIL